MSEDKLITVREASERFGCSRQNIHSHMERGNLDKLYLNRRVVTRAKSVKQLKDRLKARSSPPRKK